MLPRSKESMTLKILTFILIFLSVLPNKQDYGAASSHLSQINSVTEIITYEQPILISPILRKTTKKEPSLANAEGIYIDVIVIKAV